MTLKDQVRSSPSPADGCIVQAVDRHSSTLHNNINDFECFVSDTLQRLVKFYRNSTSFEERRQLTVAPLKGRLDYRTATVITEIQEGMLNLLELPSLCRISQTCQLLRNLSNDHVLWGRNLKRDLQKCAVINHQTHPQIYLDAGSDLTLKEIYARCCSTYYQKDTYEGQSSLTARFLKFARPYFFNKPPTRVVMFGPGLESLTSPMVHQLLWGERSPFQVEGMFPGQQDGVGSGVSLKYNEELLNLIILYSSTKKEREAAANAGLTTKNKILLENESKIEGSVVTEVNHSVRQLCKTIDAFIFVVDSSACKQKVSETKNVLQAMMDERWTVQKAPLLVLSCALSANEEFLSCADVAEALQLYDMSRHWQINRVLVDTLEGIQCGTDWLLKDC